MEEKKKYEIWIASIPHLSDRKKQMLRSRVKTGKHAYYIEETELKQMEFLSTNDREAILQAKKGCDPERLFEDLEKKGIHVTLQFETQYPNILKSVSDNPYALFYKGNLPDEKLLSVGMVGARQCTAYGEKNAYEFAKKLAEHQIQIISGLAKGIDGISQRGALMGGGRTYAVLGCGVDICYPREHIGLYQDILEKGGGIISELPMGSPPLAYQFPRRNRIISGLSKAVLVMEARERSGSLITADMALEQGRDVYALPGPIDSSLSAGCNRLIWQGAGILLSPQDFLEELGYTADGKFVESDEKESGKDVEKKKVLETKENMVYSSICLYPKSADQIVNETGLPVQTIVQILGALQIEGLIKEISKNYYIKT